MANKVKQKVFSYKKMAALIGSEQGLWREFETDVKITTLVTWRQHGYIPGRFSIKALDILEAHGNLTDYKEYLND